MNVILIQEENSAKALLSKNSFATSHTRHSSTQKYLTVSSTSFPLTIYLFFAMESLYTVTACFHLDQ